MPDSFVSIQDVIADAVIDLRYAGSDNFIGEPVDGYEQPVALITREAADALALVAQDMRDAGYRLLIYDAYRPQRAVAHFMRWARDPDDTRMKQAYYPREDKAEMFQRGYIAEKSGHSRGSTVDLTLIDASGAPLDMGTTFDFMDAQSAHGAQGLTEAQVANRALLRSAMEARGFRAYEAEWWHYTKIDEPFKDTWFDFPVRAVY